MTLKVFIKKSPSQAFSNFFNAYAKGFNKAYDRTGSLFEHPFGRVKVTNHTYLLSLITYIHINPKHHGFVQDYRDWPYTSYHALVSDNKWLHRDQVNACFGGTKQFQDHHGHLAELSSRKHLLVHDLD